MSDFRHPFPGDPIRLTPSEMLRLAERLEHRAATRHLLDKQLAQACRDSAKSLRELAAAEALA